MTVQQLRAVLGEKPFRPFTLQLADGDRVRVRQPEFARLTPGGRTLVVALGDEQIKIIDLLLVTAIHRGNGRAARSK